MRRAAFFGVVLWGAGQAFAQAPVVNEIFPAGGRRGTTVDVVFAGANLNDVVAVVGHSPCKVELKPDGKPTAAAVPVRVTIPADCRSGNFEFRLVTKTGVSLPRVFAVGDLPEVTEVEPNNTIGTAQPVTLPVVINGRVSGEDVDCFSFPLKAGERVSFEAAARELTGGIEPVLTLYDERGREIAGSEDTPAGSMKVRFEYAAPRDGKYVLEIRESTYKGVGCTTYRLRIGAFPHAIAAFPPGGKRGTTVEVSTVGGPSSTPVKQAVAVPADAPDRMMLRIAAAGGPESAEVPFFVSDYDEINEAEPNDDPKSAQKIAAVPVVVNGRIDRNGDRDCFAVTMKKGTPLTFDIDARTLDSPLDSHLTIFDAAGKQLAANDDDGPRPDSKITFNPPADGVYTVMVRDINLRGGPEYVYRLTIAPARPDFSLTVDSDTLAAAPEGAVPLVITAARNGYNGPIAVELVGLPAGVSAVPAPVIAEGQTACLTTLVAATGTEPAGGTLRVVGSAEIGGAKRSRTASAKIILVPGAAANQPPQVVWETTQLGVSVRTPAPFTLAAKSPEVVVVPGLGSTPLPVTVKRSKEAQDAITLTVLGLPKGVTFDAKTATVAKGAAEGSAVITVPAGTPTGTYNIAVAATTSAGGKKGAVTVGQSTPAFRVVIKSAFEVSTDTSALPLAAGATATVPVKLVRNGAFADAVTIAVTGLPAGVTAAPLTIDKGKAEGTLTLTAAKDAKAGNAKLTVTGTAKVGAAPANVNAGPIALTVTAEAKPEKKDEKK